MREFKKGRFVKIKLDQKSSDWYHEDAMEILGFKNDCYVVDAKYFGETGTTNIYFEYVYQDDECKKLSGKLNREEKLKRIIALTPEEYLITKLDGTSRKIEITHYKNKKGFFQFYNATKKILTINKNLINTIELNEKE